MNKLSVATTVTSLAIILSTGSAGATHKAWTRVEPGTQCVPANPAQYNQISYASSFYNTGTSYMAALCPVRLGGQSTAKTGTLVFPIHDALEANYLNIFVKDGDAQDYLDCRVYVNTKGGGGIVSQMRWACSSVGGCNAWPPDNGFTGTAKLSFVSGNQSIDFFPALANQIDQRSMAFFCYVTKQGEILGTKTSICMNDPISNPGGYGQCRDFNSGF